MKIIALLIFIAVVALAVLGATAGQTAVNRYYDHKEQPLSAIDAVMQSRQTPPVAPEPPNRWGAMLLPIAVLLVAGFVIALLFYGERFAKQWRLLTKKKRPSAAPYLPQSPQPPYPDWRDVPPVRQIPAPREDGNDPY